jgi:hypothetical protein
LARLARSPRSSAALPRLTASRASFAACSAAAARRHALTLNHRPAVLTKSPAMPAISTATCSLEGKYTSRQVPVIASRVYQTSWRAIMFIQRPTAVHMVEVDSRFRGNDDAGGGCPEYCHSRGSGNPLPASGSASESLQRPGLVRTWWLGAGSPTGDLFLT